MTLEKRPRGVLAMSWEEVRWRRVGRSEAFRMVGLALRISDMALRRLWVFGGFYV